MSWIQQTVALSILIAALYFGYQREIDALSVTCGVLLALLLMISPGSLKVFKIFGIEARLEGKIREAEDVVTELQALAIAISDPAIAFLTPLGMTQT